jgi:acetyl-CoA acetyltransferase
MKDSYIVTSVRTPGCRRNKGAFKDTRPDDLLSFILDAAVDKTENLEKKDVDDIMIGCSFPEAEQGLNIGRIASQMAGFPIEVSGATVNRFCSSGLEAIALAALKVQAGWADVTIGGGVESMTYVPMGGSIPRPHPEFSKKQSELYISMGLTAENVARRYRSPENNRMSLPPSPSRKPLPHVQTGGLRKSCRPRQFPSSRKKTAPSAKRPLFRIMMTAYGIPPRSRALQN